MILHLFFSYFVSSFGRNFWRARINPNERFRFFRVSYSSFSTCYKFAKLRGFKLHCILGAQAVLSVLNESRVETFCPNSTSFFIFKRYVKYYAAIIRECHSLFVLFKFFF